MAKDNDIASDENNLAAGDETSQASSGGQTKGSGRKRLALGAVVVLGLGALALPRLIDGDAVSPAVGLMQDQLEKLGPGEFAPDIGGEANAQMAADDAPTTEEGTSETITASEAADAVTSEVTEVETVAAEESGVADSADNPGEAVEPQSAEVEIGVTGADGETPGEDVLGSDTDPDAAARALLAANAERRAQEELTETGEAQEINPEATDPELNDDGGEATTVEIDELAQATAAAEAEAQALAARVAELEAQLDAAQTDEDNPARALAIADLRVAVAEGAPFQNAIAVLQATGTAVPPALMDAGEGVPTLGELQDEYPRAAHAALRATIDASRTDKWYDGVLIAFKSEFASRAIEPKEGNSPDAVLSRAEAYLAEENLEAALGELSLLPSEAQAAMAEWLERAQKRQRVLAAVKTLATEN